MYVCYTFSNSFHRYKLLFNYFVNVQFIVLCSKRSLVQLKKKIVILHSAKTN